MPRIVIKEIRIPLGGKGVKARRMRDEGMGDERWETRDERRDEAPHRLIRKRIDGRESEESRSLLADVLLAARRMRWQQGQELRRVNGAMEQQRGTRILTAVVLQPSLEGMKNPKNYELSTIWSQWLRGGFS
ncbi:predicted protein [Histoplasma capsulatum G186AR]|uniref:Uncharacterized protein n=1 Tax=Ajellomyces capsulatus (strain G186AR / H82 / ATCC MYA-2454 / RMSCC 2432) TaxID=447093 RepID=C0NBB5_AJECG|nr:uncharacterized protein HCBG_00411 [Histoplasma capsulatum G186AR]EEH10956.1 predicted protein [Histoplasma capsulatum G186AR]